MINLPQSIRIAVDMTYHPWQTRQWKERKKDRKIIMEISMFEHRK